MRGGKSRVKKVINDRLAVIETLPIATTQTTDPTPTPTPATKTRQPRKSSEPELPALQDVIDLRVTSLTWSQMLKLVGLDSTEKPKAATAELALSLAAGMGVPISPKFSSTPGWFYTPDKKFEIRVQKT